ncbi:DUF6636 domain-containing protein [Cellulomonas sp. URHD0024]|uniref:DUF6636 domain-containing protein n=1 Tax=Cellulomonas sp. URHD0024 TaxID=1302620 RepID=UPI000422309E|nr:DUF6636 domain-containing protein [Cellulomonas sp. URHD0024]
MRSRRTLVVVFVVLDVLLVVLLVAIALSRGSGGNGDGGDDTAATSGGPSASSHPSVSASKPSTKITSFAMPSGNIACAMSVDGVTCTIARYTYAPPVVAGCTEVTGHVLVLNADGVAFSCVSGPPPAAAGDDVPHLEYGKTTTVGEYTCTSATDGVQCVDGSGKGFQLASGSWKEIP